MPNAGPARSGPSKRGRSKIARLRKRPEFLRVAAARTKFVAPGLILQARRASAADSACEATADAGIRVGLTVSRKVGNAVERNRVKRRLRALANEVLPELGCGGADYVLIGRREALTRPYDSLREDLRNAVRKLNRNLTPRAARAKPPAEGAHS
jgi:ribonuclease P protein component